MSETKWAQLSVRLPAELVAQVKERSQQEDRPVVTVVKRALLLYLAQEGRA